jgi:alpha-tubulin suppressor-like RCC1 family protein
MGWMRLAAILVGMLCACGRVGFDARLDASTVRPDGTIPTNDGSVDLSCVAQIEAGSQHVCVRATDGRVWCWGRSDFMQLGDGFGGTRNYPALAPALAASASIALGGYHVCRLDGTGNLACLGANYLGQLGIGAAGPSQPTLQVVSTALPTEAAQVAAGEEHTCARLVDGRVYCWGRNFDGELGDGTNMQRDAPVFTGITNATYLVAGNHHNCALTAVPDDVVCWGDNQFGQLGDGTKMDRRTPTPIGLTGSSLIAAGDHTCVLDTNGMMSCWGYNQNGQLGNNSTLDSPTPVTPQGLGQVTTIALGYKHTCAIDVASDLYCWGQNLYGQIGNSAFADQRVPYRVYGASTPMVRLVTAGWDFTCAMDPQLLSCWGANDQGQLGDATNDSFTLPKPSLLSCNIQ